MATKIKMIHSLRMFTELTKLGYTPVATMENPTRKGYLYWVYEVTPEM